ncbi:hypothetical protein OJF2_16870 [Aquisphaera giovannonii]|uniref:Uncharacterized protein n=1 Tax=Aquisphaera giovannonii TaxID=406548 RepID=A0A5B9VZT2_9BACT|nr:hypothetical protein OJF2_16870 [Aquisphaera giovannonii]
MTLASVTTESGSLGVGIARPTSAGRAVATEDVGAVGAAIPAASEAGGAPGVVATGTVEAARASIAPRRSGESPAGEIDAFAVAAGVAVVAAP